MNHIDRWCFSLPIILSFSSWNLSWYVAFAFAVCVWLLKKLSRRYRSLFGRRFWGLNFGRRTGPYKMASSLTSLAPGTHRAAKNTKNQVWILTTPAPANSIKHWSQQTPTWIRRLCRMAIRLPNCACKACATDRQILAPKMGVKNQGIKPGRFHWPSLWRACTGPLNCYWRATNTSHAPVSINTHVRIQHP